MQTEARCRLGGRVQSVAINLNAGKDRPVMGQVVMEVLIERKVSLPKYPLKSDIPRYVATPSRDDFRNARAGIFHFHDFPFSDFSIVGISPFSDQPEMPKLKPPRPPLV